MKLTIVPFAHLIALALLILLGVSLNRKSSRSRPTRTPTLCPSRLRDQPRKCAAFPPCAARHEQIVFAPATVLFREPRRPHI